MQPLILYTERYQTVSYIEAGTYQPGKEPVYGN